MNKEDLVVHPEMIQFLSQTLEKGRISHAQLFSGNAGYGIIPTALWYASQILSIGNPNAAYKVAHLQHPDLHFSYPTVKKGKTDALSVHYSKEWKDFLKQNPYADLQDWYRFLEVDNKQGLITVAEIQQVIEDISLTSYEGGYKVLIVWHADKMNTNAANKFLKFLEEPPKNTVIILTTDNEENILTTIQSRCQLLAFKPIPEEYIISGLQNQFQLEEPKAQKVGIMAQGNWNEALKNLEDNPMLTQYNAWFVHWTRNAFLARKNAKSLREILFWAENLATLGREQQKSFLAYCSEVFRQALLKNYQADELVFMDIEEEGFQFDKFSYYISGSNIEDILTEISTTSYYIERNANAKIAFLDLGIKLTRFIHRKPTA